MLVGYVGILYQGDIEFPEPMARFLNRLRNMSAPPPNTADPAGEDSRMQVHHAELSDTGRVRSSNQDNLLADAELGLWVVADGMGGHAGGAEASRIACEAVHEAITHGMALADAFEVAHSRVRAAQEGQPALADMGTTLVAIQDLGTEFELAWVGDSRAYRLNRNDNGFACLTRDHNIAGRLLADGQITAEQARAHPQRNVLTDCIGQIQGLPSIETERLAWRRGDRLLLCSDGLSSELDDSEIQQWLQAIDPARDAAGKLLQSALAAGGHDNVTLIVLDAQL